MNNLSTNKFIRKIRNFLLNTESKIYICYRKKDRDQAVQLKLVLIKNQPNWEIFVDTDDIECGDYFRQVLAKELKKCQCLIVIIGQEWGEAFDLKKKENKEDWVLKEIRIALELNIPIIPVMIGVNNFEEIASIPEEISEIRGFQSRKLDFSNTKRLHDVIEEIEISIIKNTNSLIAGASTLSRSGMHIVIILFFALFFILYFNYFNINSIRSAISQINERLIVLSEKESELLLIGSGAVYNYLSHECKINDSSSCLTPQITKNSKWPNSRVAITDLNGFRIIAIGVGSGSGTDTLVRSSFDPNAKEHIPSFPILAMYSDIPQLTELIHNDKDQKILKNRIFAVQLADDNNLEIALNNSKCVELQKENMKSCLSDKRMPLIYSQNMPHISAQGLECLLNACEDEKGTCKVSLTSASSATIKRLKESIPTLENRLKKNQYNTSGMAMKGFYPDEQQNCWIALGSRYLYQYQSEYMPVNNIDVYEIQKDNKAIKGPLYLVGIGKCIPSEHSLTLGTAYCRYLKLLKEQSTLKSKLNELNIEDIPEGCNLGIANCNDEIHIIKSESDSSS